MIETAEDDMRTARKLLQTGDPLSLDSLLDTLMCVVGVSLVVLAAAQLQLLQAVRDRGADTMPVAMDHQLQAERGRVDQLEARLKILHFKQNLQAEMTQNEAEELRTLQDRHAELKSEANRLRDGQQRLATLQQDEKQLESERAGLTADMQDLRTEIDRLQEAIATAKPATIIHLPVRRTVQKKLDPVYFVCRFGRVYPLHIDQLREEFRKSTRTLRDSFTRSMSQDQRVHRAISYFNKTHVGNEYFRIKMQALYDNQQFYGFMILMGVRNQEQGETMDAALKPGSQFVKAVRQVDPQRQFVKFWVWSDSFAHYVRLRHKVEELHATEDGVNTRVGLSWVPYAQDEEIKEFWDVLGIGPKDSDRKPHGTPIDN